MANTPQDTYLGLMRTIRGRFDIIDALRVSNSDAFFKTETIAFNGRKIIEGIAFGCLVALENGLNHVPRDVRGQWNAQDILKSLEKKKFDTVFPSPSIIRAATEEEAKKYNVRVTVEGQPDKRISSDELIQIYSRLHRWAHEINPYTEKEGRDDFLEKNEPALMKDIEKLWAFIEKHTISINGEMFFCVLKDKADGMVKVINLSKQEDI